MSLLRFFHPVLASRALRTKPVKVSVAGESFALFRDERGRACALADRCPHRFAPLSAGRVERGKLVCAYHGWSFDGDGRGKSASQPALAKCDVRSMRAVERHGYVWIANRESEDEVPNFDFGEARSCGAFSVRFDAPLHVVLDNFSEDEHTPFVHTRLGWQSGDVEKIGFHAESFDDRTEVHYDAPQRPTRVGRIFGLRPGDIFHNDWVTRFDPPCTTYTTQWVDPKTSATRPLRITSPIYFVPESDSSTILHTFVFAETGEPHARFFPLLRHVVTAIAWAEIRDDARFIPTVKHTPRSMRGMRLGKFDKPLVHNRRLLDRLYFANESDVANDDDGAKTIQTGS
ncbi:MAG TPA: Rieske 2Fe-2S domain-containing protein [Polyangiaceae bacterium]|jgi:phenylpropionate dioxygenase-like ring-hydroxylating dioxygenase large terminal subunit|nr:Rieske 2Fe-2S domain-containing protein [Polyangiaceae bacterium]